MAVILGIDPGSRTCGYGLINSVGNKLEYIASGCIRLEKLDFPRRLHTIFVTLGEIIEKYQPRTAAVEEMFLGKNAASAIKLGQARGAALVACSNQDVEIVEYSTRKVKQA
ncbi:MAG: crossover junction endodeoxyribonuclease RuvC, partial [Haliea sp.]